MHLQRTIQLPSDADATGRSFGDEELGFLREALASGTLNCTKGTQVKAFEQDFAELYGVPYCRAVASGTAACHTACAAFDFEPGDEVITTPITDMGAIGPLLYQMLIPIFADVDSVTLNVAAETIEARITSRTRAIIVTHIFGNPCDMKGILNVAKKYNLHVIEDCAQAYLARVDGQLVGTFGEVGCFSLQQGKHMTAGEGGMVITQDPDLHRRMVLFSDKAWGYGDPQPDHYFLAPNYRLTELQGAVARGQLQKLEKCVEIRQQNAALMAEMVGDLPGLTLPAPAENATHAYWRYPLTVDANVIKGGADALGAYLKEHGVYCMPRYIQKPAFECEVLRCRKTFGTSELPYSLSESLAPNPADYPGTYQGLSQVVVLPWNERYNIDHVSFIAQHIREGVACLTSR